MAQAQYLARLVDHAPNLELLARVSLNLVNFRYRPPNGRQCSDAEIDAMNVEILQCLQERGIAVPSSTRVHGKFAIRVAITNHRTRFADLDVLVNTVQSIGGQLVKQ